MHEDFTDHDRWGLVIDKHRSVHLEFGIRNKRDVIKIRGLIPKFQNMPIGEFVSMIGDANIYTIEFPTDYGNKIAAAANESGVVCNTQNHERLDYLIYDIAAGDLLELDDEAEYERIVEILKINENPIIDVNVY